MFLIAPTASYLSFQSFVDSGSRYFSTSWGGIQWEKQVRNSAQIHRSGSMSVLVTGAIGFVGTQVSLALKKRGDNVVGIGNAPRDLQIGRSPTGYRLGIVELSLQAQREGSIFEIEPNRSAGESVRCDEEGR
ncbi:UDP-glucuronate 4-epimerase 1 [Linum perenne]